MNPVWIGRFDREGSPTITVSISGAKPHISTEFEAIIDTGFTGFISMPIAEAFPLGLVLKGTSIVSYANGSTASILTAFGVAAVDDEEVTGIISLEQQPCSILLGMEFLSQFKRGLIIHPAKMQVLLPTEEKFDEMMNAL